MRPYLLFPIALAACSQIDASRIFTPAAVQPAIYQTFDSAQAATSVLSGTALVQDSGGDSPTLRASTGSLNHGTGAFILNDGTYRLEDPDGLSAQGVATDSASVLTVSGTVGSSAGLDYARAYTQSYTVGGAAYQVQGIVGIATQSADMPMSGTADWSGGAEGRMVTPAGTTLLGGGSSAVSADFAEGTIEATMTGFTASDAATGRSTTVGFDAVTLADMAISGNRFSGRSVTTSLAGSEVSVVGDVTGQSASGRFFGPGGDEVGGAALLTGAGGRVQMLFLAD